jgi:hypothetical protein
MSVMLQAMMNCIFKINKWCKRAAQTNVARLARYRLTPCHVRPTTGLINQAHRILFSKRGIGLTDFHFFAQLKNKIKVVIRHLAWVANSLKNASFGSIGNSEKETEEEASVGYNGLALLI